MILLWKILHKHILKYDEYNIKGKGKEKVGTGYSFFGRGDLLLKKKVAAQGL
jgi:hypothetical protein